MINRQIRRFPINERYSKTEIVGLDIVELALNKNHEKAVTDGLKNIRFARYNSLTFPFADEQWDIITTLQLPDFKTKQIESYKGGIAWTEKKQQRKKI